MSNSRIHVKLPGTRLLIAAAAIALSVAGCAASSATHENCSANCSDAEISALVRKHLFDRASIPDTGISVSTVDGVVYLHGLVNTSVERNAAVAAAREVPGVSEVVDSLEISGSN